MEPCKFDHTGNYIDHTPASALTAGDLVLIGSLIGIAVNDIPAGKLGALCVRGVFDVPKDASNLATAGTAIYWDADGNPVGGTAGTGCFTATATGNTFAGWNLEVAGAAAGTVLAFIDSAFAVSVTTLDALTDVGTVAHTAGSIIVADGTKYEEVAVSGDATLASTGALTLNDAHAEEAAYIPVDALAAGADLAATFKWAHPRACTLVSIGFLSAGSFGTVSDASTAVFAVTDGAGNAIVSKTYNTATQPSTTAINDLGALDGTHKVLTAGEAVKLAITNGATAATPAGVLVVRYIPTHA